MPEIINRRHASRKRRQAKTTENAANWKRLVKAAEKFADAAQRIAERHDMAIDAEPDGKHNEQLTGYAMAQQMLAILAKFLPPVGHQSSAEEPDFEELHEKPEPKDVRPIPKKKGNCPGANCRSRSPQGGEPAFGVLGQGLDDVPTLLFGGRYE
jgi:hypothetical protein